MTKLVGLAAVIFFILMSCSTKKAVTNTTTAEPQSDSTKLVIVLENLLEACWQCPQGGNCSKVASLIVYSGRSEPERAWKTLADYSKEEDRQIVDQGCSRIKKLLPEGSKYRITKFQKAEESEGVWHVLTVIPDNQPDKEKLRHIEFAFLNIGGQFALGDIDSYTYR